MRLHGRIKSLISLRVDGSIIGLDKRGMATLYQKKRLCVVTLEPHNTEVVK